MFGRIELTIFPRTWEEYQDKIQREKIVVVWGKAEVRDGGTPKLLVERVSDSLTRAASADVRQDFSTPQYDEPMPMLAQAHTSAAVNAPAAQQARTEAVVQRPAAQQTVVQQSVVQQPVSTPVKAAASTAKTAPRMLKESTLDSYDIPPEPEFSDDIPYEDGVAESVDTDIWIPDDFAPARSNGKGERVEAKATGSVVAVATAPSLAMTQTTRQLAAKPASANSASAKPAMAQYAAVTLAPAKPASSAPAPARVDAPLSTGPILVVIRRCGNVKQDVARMEAIHQTLLEFKGKQSFSIRLRNGGRQDVTLDFPNDVTRDCVELRMKLTALGAEMVQSQPA